MQTSEIFTLKKKKEEMFLRMLWKDLTKITPNKNYLLNQIKARQL